MADAKLGEWTETKDATEETQKLCDKMNFSLLLLFIISTHKILCFPF